MKHFDIDLDLAPDDRFKVVERNFNFKKVKEKYEEVYESYKPTIPFFETFIRMIVSLHKDKIMFYDEIVYWSDKLEVPFYKVVIMQLLYEANAACTTFVGKFDGKNTMIRTMDWPMEFLKKFTYQATFYRDKKPIYEAVCWIGSVGVFTGKSITQEYSLALNYRRTKEISIGTILTNFKNTIYSYWPVAYLTRHVLENQYTCDETAHILQSYALISPVYYILNNFNSYPIIIQRDTETYTCITGSYVIQTNCDNDKTEPDILYSVYRMKHVTRLLKKTCVLSNVIKGVCKYPVMNDETIYMSIINKDTFKTNLT